MSGGLFTASRRILGSLNQTTTFSQRPGPNDDAVDLAFPRSTGRPALTNRPSVSRRHPGKRAVRFPLATSRSGQRRTELTSFFPVLYVP